MRRSKRAIFLKIMIYMILSASKDFLVCNSYRIRAFEKILLCILQRYLALFKPKYSREKWNKWLNKIADFYLVPQGMVYVIISRWNNRFFRGWTHFTNVQTHFPEPLPVSLLACQSSMQSMPVGRAWFISRSPPVIFFSSQQLEHALNIWPVSKAMIVLVDLNEFSSIF